MRFNGTLDELRSLVEEFDYVGTWSEAADGRSVFKSTAGRLTLNWWSASVRRTLQAQGVEKEVFEERYESYFKRGAIVGNRVPFGDITIGVRIGGGGFGVVHRAAVSGVDFPFAVKFGASGSCVG